jgi:hypothetical protein
VLLTIVQLITDNVKLSINISCSHDCLDLTDHRVKRARVTLSGYWGSHRLLSNSIWQQRIQIDLRFGDATESHEEGAEVPIQLICNRFNLLPHSEYISQITSAVLPYQRERLRKDLSSSVICQTTGPQPLPKRFLHLMRSRASSFKLEYPLRSPRSSSNFLRLLPRLYKTIQI